MSFLYHVLKDRPIHIQDDEVLQPYGTDRPLVSRYGASVEAKYSGSVCRMSVNADLIRARCAEIEASVARLEQFQTLSLEAFRSKRDALDVASYRLLIAIEASLALC